MNAEPDLAHLLAPVLALLRRTEPESQQGDLTWHGPYFIPRHGQWWPTRFVLYQDELYCQIEVGRSTYGLMWKVGTDQVTFQGEPGFDAAWNNGPEFWLMALRQIKARLRDALAHPSAYRRRVEKWFPTRCRTGRVQRLWTWPARAPKPLTDAELERFEDALRAGGSARALRRLSVTRFLEVAAWAYDVAFPEMAALTPLEKYRRRADTRHGGMLDLPPDDSPAFAHWYDSRNWAGAHPWEIVFAHPHGIMLSPTRAPGGWRFYISVDTLGLYVQAARAATALGEHGVPFELVLAAEVLAAIRGEDEVEVGPFYGQLPLDELAERRRAAVTHVRWDEPLLVIARNKTTPMSLHS